MSYYKLNTGIEHGQIGQEVTGSRARYLPFGGWRTEPTTSLTDMGFTSHKTNNTGSGDIGLIYMNARFYSPSSGRFISADIIVPNPANPQSFNRYSYVLNSPLNFTDPTGHAHAECSTAGECGTAEAGWVYNAINYLVGSAANGNGLANFILETYSQYASEPIPDGEHIYQEDLYMMAVESGYDKVTGIMAARGYESADEAWTKYVQGKELFDGIFMAGAFFYVERAQGTKAYVTGSYLAGQGCSFSYETPIFTANGYQPIGDLEIGDDVLAYNEKTGEIAYYPITATWVHLDPVVMYLTINEEIIETTPTHPFYTAEGWVEAGNLYS